MNNLDPIKVEKIQEIVERFNSLKEWEDRYSLIIEMGKMLPMMNDELKSEQNKIKGCQSQVWLWANYIDGKVYFVADSDASIVKGIIALLVEIYSGLTPSEILNFKPDFLGQIGLVEHLSMSRANGLSSMLKQIQFYAMAFLAQGNRK